MEVLTENQETQTTRKISKVKLTKSGCPFVEFQETRIVVIGEKSIEKVSNLTFEGLNLPHPDLLHAFDLLRAHLAILCSQLDGRDAELSDLEDEEKFISLFKVSGFSIGGSGETEGVTLIGSKKIKRGVLNLVTPFTKFMDENAPYEYGDELNHLVYHAIEEANLYLDDKIAPDAQTKIEYPDNEDQSELE